MSCEPLNLGTIPSPRVQTKHCACGELLTLECEFDVDTCVDCQADIAKLHESPERASA